MEEKHSNICEKMHNFQDSKFMSDTKKLLKINGDHFSAIKIILESNKLNSEEDKINSLINEIKKNRSEFMQTYSINNWDSIQLIKENYKAVFSSILGGLAFFYMGLETLPDQVRKNFEQTSRIIDILLEHYFFSIQKTKKNLIDDTDNNVLCKYGDNNDIKDFIFIFKELVKKENLFFQEIQERQRIEQLEALMKDILQCFNILFKTDSNNLNINLKLPS